MSFRRSAAIARHEFRIFRRDPTFFFIFLGMPLLLMAFMRSATRYALVDQGFRGVNGSEQAVPGMTVMFAFFLVGNLGFGFMREHGWNTWERLRASWATSSEIVVGKTIVPLCQAIVHMSLLFTIGVLAFGLRIEGDILALVAVGLSLSVCLIALGFALAALCRSVMQLNALSNLGALLFAGLGGALAPLSSLPDWAQGVSRATPSYWAMRGFRSVILDDGGLGDVALPVAVLLVFTAAFSAVAVARFRVEETKTAWA